MQKTVTIAAITTRNIAATNIIEIGDDFVTFQRKKPHTSKVVDETITVGGQRSLLAVYGMVGSSGTVVVQEPAQVYYDQGEVITTDKYVETVNECPTRFFRQEGVSMNIVSEAYDLEGSEETSETTEAAAQ